MNLKQIDGAISAYSTALSDEDRTRLEFFRSLWSVQKSISEELCTDLEPVQVPQKIVTSCFTSQEPLLLDSPVAIDQDTLTKAIERVVSYLIESDAFSDSTASSLKRVKWDRLVAASDSKLAGSNPCAYVDLLQELLLDDNATQEAARTGRLAVSFALKAILDSALKKTQQDIAKIETSSSHPTQCPLCGSAPAVARVLGSGAIQGGAKQLWCGQCGTVWDFERIRCVRCGERNQSHLHYYNIEGDEAHRIATCDTCGGYTRTVYQEDSLAPFSFEVEDVVMTRLDMLAYEHLAAQESAD